MNLSKVLKRLGSICFLLVWVPFSVLMFKGPLSIMMNGPEATAQNMSENFFWENGIWIGLIIFFSVASPFFFVASLVVGGISNRKIVNNGLDAEARILALNDTGTRINNNPVVNFVLEVKPMGQPAFQAEANQTVSVLHLPSYQPGKIVHVKFVPETRQVAIVGAKNF